MSFDTMTIIVPLSVVATIVLTVLIYAKIMPEGRKGKLSRAGQVLRDFLNFKILVIDKIFKGIYILLTVFCIVLGFLILLGFRYNGHGRYATLEWNGAYGLVIMIAGPIIIRLIYELIIIIITPIKNAIENKKDK